MVEQYELLDAKFGKTGGKMYYICKRLQFESSHRLSISGLSDEDNAAKFGKCANSPSHGHSYKLFVTLRGNELQDGMLINFSEVSRVVKQQIVERFDHHFINDLMPTQIPTAENMCKLFYDQLKSFFSQLYSVKLYETEDSWAEYREEE